MALHELALERRNLHGHFSRELEPVLEIDSGESFAFATLDAGWGSSRRTPTARNASASSRATRSSIPATP